MHVGGRNGEKVLFTGARRNLILAGRTVLLVTSCNLRKEARRTPRDDKTKIYDSAALALRLESVTLEVRRGENERYSNLNLTTRQIDERGIITNSFLPNDNAAAH